MNREEPCVRPVTLFLLRAVDELNFFSIPDQIVRRKFQSVLQKVILTYAIEQ